MNNVTNPSNGDLFIMLRGPIASGSVPWQTELQETMGGTAPFALHLTCQRLSVTSPETLDGLLEFLNGCVRELEPFGVTGEEVDIRPSYVRDCPIAKCMVTPGPVFDRFLDAINQYCDVSQIERHYHTDMTRRRIPVTVLECLRPEATTGPATNRIVQKKLFTVETLHVSQMLERYVFRDIAEWHFSPVQP